LALCAASLCACGGDKSVQAPDPVPAGMTAIYAIQGEGRESPLAGQTVRASGVVTGDFQHTSDAPRLGGFYIQSQAPDGNLLTSDGVFVYDGESPERDVAVGDVVVVDGTVTEHFGETQIVAESVTVTGTHNLQPLNLALPASQSIMNADNQTIADLESLEGMLVRIPQSLTVSGLYDMERFGEMLLSAGGRVMHFTNVELPDTSGYSRFIEAKALRELRVDDGSARQNVSPIRFLFPRVADDNPTRVGDTVVNPVGNIRFSRGSGGSGIQAYRLVVASDLQFRQDNPRPVVAPDPGGNLKVASFNLQNYFTTVDDGKPVCGPARDSNCRGANDLDEYSRQRAKLRTALNMLDAGIVGLVEMENDGDRALQSIVADLNEAAGNVKYAYVQTGNFGTDAIRVGLIYQPAIVSRVGNFAVIDSSVDSRYLDSKNRPSLAQTFRHLESGGVLTVVVSHLKSKGSPCDDVNDPDTGDGQANCSLTRTSAISALADWLASDPTASNDDDVLLIGDLNAYLREEPLTQVEAAGYTSLLPRFAGPDSYSFIFAGASGALDHAIVSHSLLAQVAGAAEWHINADESPALDYNLDFARDPEMFDALTPYRVSDHDPVVVGLQLVGQ
jgi:predicted extracellular nuclease